MASLARELALSRSAFAARFTRLVDEPAMQYLARWRMQLAQHAFETEDATVAELAGRLGYQSEAAFARAFKRVIGIHPAPSNTPANRSQQALPPSRHHPRRGRARRGIYALRGRSLVPCHQMFQATATDAAVPGRAETRLVDSISVPVLQGHTSVATTMMNVRPPDEGLPTAVLGVQLTAVPEPNDQPHG